MSTAQTNRKTTDVDPAVFLKTAAMVADIAQAAHLHMLGNIASHKRLGLLLLASLTYQLERLDGVDPTGMTEIVNLMRATVADATAGETTLETATPAGMA